MVLFSRWLFSRLMSSETTTGAQSIQFYSVVAHVISCHNEYMLQPSDRHIRFLYYHQLSRHKGTQSLPCKPRHGYAQFAGFLSAVTSSDELLIWDDGLNSYCNLAISPPRRRAGEEPWLSASACKSLNFEGQSNLVSLPHSCLPL